MLSSKKNIYLNIIHNSIHLFTYIVCILIFIKNANALSPMHKKPSELLIQLSSKNWVEAMKAVKVITSNKIKTVENQLILLINNKVNVSLLEEVIKALTILESTKAYKSYMELFPAIKNQIRYKFVLIKMIESIGKSKEMDALHFLGSILNNKSNDLYLREHAAKNLRFFKEPDAAKYLIKALKPEWCILTKNILVSLRYNARYIDIFKIKSMIDQIIKPIGKNDFDKAIEREIGDFSKSMDYFIFIEFMKSTIDIIQNRFQEKVFVLGDINGKIDPLKFEIKIKELIHDGKYKILKGRKNRRPIYVADSEETENELYASSFIQTTSNIENPEVNIIIATLIQNGISFYRSKNGLLMEQKDSRIGRWSKDGSILIPLNEGFIPLSMNFGNFPVRGETAFISGENPLLVRSIDSFSSITALKAFEEKFPDINIEAIPHGYVTVKMKSGEFISLGTSHIDCVFDFIPGELSKDGLPILLIDSYYHDELISNKKTKSFLETLEKQYSVKKVIIPEEESFLNPANFLLIPEGKLVMNKAPLTFQKLIDAGIKPNAITMTIKPIYQIAPLKGMVGCLGGIYTKDRIITQLNDIISKNKHFVAA